MIVAQDLEAHRVALTGHCYRMLGSVTEAEDAVQETLLRAWRAREGFDGRAALRTWLTRIATHVCFDALADGRRRTRPLEEGPAGTVHDTLVSPPHTHWIEPAPAALLVPSDDDPARRAALRQSVRLAFVAALQHLPPRQRAALLLADVLDWPASEVAEVLEITVAATNSALQRARATLGTRGIAADTVAQDALPPRDAALLGRFVTLFERYDVDALAALCREDVAFSMPPFSLWLEGPRAVAAWLNGRGAACVGSRVVVVSAGDDLVYAQYKRRHDGHGYHAWGLGVLEVEAGQIVRWTTFLDTATLFPRFGLALDLAPDPAGNSAEENRLATDESAPARESMPG